MHKNGQVITKGSFITAGNASQLSDSALAGVVMEASQAEQRSLQPLGRYISMMAQRCEPDKMGIRKVFEVLELVPLDNLKMNDIRLWELNEAFASQLLYCRNQLGMPNALLNINGLAIAISRPYGMSGARMVGHALIQDHRRSANYVVSTMCVGHGMGATGLFEVLS
ncbi:MAG: hypothetical protein P8M25_12395 [Paracoccaceae bacterium]|nr:hypothetical protein [Paracoccaceae bacterium]